MLELRAWKHEEEKRCDGDTGEAYQHLPPNPGRQVVEEQDKDKCLSVTGSGSADIFHDI